MDANKEYEYKSFSIDALLQIKQKEYADRQTKEIEEEEQRLAEAKARKEEQARIKREAIERKRAEEKAKKEEQERIKREEIERKKAEKVYLRLKAPFDIYVDKVTDNLQAMMTARMLLSWSSADFRNKINSLPLKVLTLEGKVNADKMASQLNNGGFVSSIKTVEK